MTKRPDDLGEEVRRQGPRPSTLLDYGFTRKNIPPSVETLGMGNRSDPHTHISWDQTLAICESLGKSFEGSFSELFNHWHGLPKEEARILCGFFSEGLRGENFAPPLRGTQQCLTAHRMGQMIRQLRPRLVPLFPGHNMVNYTLTPRQRDRLLVLEFGEGLLDSQTYLFSDMEEEEEEVEDVMVLRLCTYRYTVEDILSRGGWPRDPKGFGTVLMARMRSIERQYTPRRPTLEDQANTFTTLAPLPSSPREEGASSNLLTERGLSRSRWNPAERTINYLISDDAIPSFLQMTLPALLPTESDRNSMESLTEFLQDTYFDRDGEHGIIVEIVGNNLLDPQGERFEAIAGGNCMELAREFEIRESFYFPLSPSPARNRWEADCVEERHQEAALPL